jgi:glycosyltransferase involved in cell wall biosynthesis
VIRALDELPDATLTIHGPQLTDADRQHRLELERIAGDRVVLGDDVPYAQVPQLLGLADAVVNATQGNSADKVVYEAAAACLPVFAASPVFDTLLPDALRFTDSASLADRIRAYDGGAGRALREQVEAQHSVGHWAERVLEAAGA